MKHQARMEAEPVSPPARRRGVHLLATAGKVVTTHRLLRVSTITLWYLFIVTLSYAGAFWLRFDGKISPHELRLMFLTLPILLGLRVAAFRFFDLYSGLLHYVSVDEVWRTMKAVGASSAAFTLILFAATPRFQGYPRSVLVIEMMLALGALSCYRMALRAKRERAERVSNGSRHGDKAKRILLIGALNHVDSLLRDGSFLSNGNGGTRLLGIVSDNPSCVGKRLRNTRVLGVTDDLGRIAQKTRPDEILVLPPHNMPHALRKIMESSQTEDRHPCKYMTVPSLSDIAEGKISVSRIRNVQIEDLLGRDPVMLDRTDVKAFLAGKSVMVTGAGGSIGAELCRQIAHYAPARIVLYERNEYNLYTIERALTKVFPLSRIIPVAGDVCDERGLAKAVKAYHVEVIYHAAGYKHVPLMEQNVSACVKTNVFGTECAAGAAEICGVGKFVLVSTDKAVRPTSVMGASKRLAERLIQDRPRSGTKFVAVRFGNVLGSSGSVIPLFEQQIREGGPVTVTHPEITRFFMSIPEAVDLVLQAAVIGKDREIMVLEMGHPIKISDLAKRLIELSGLRPGKDIEVRFTGLRPGEKLYEELMALDDNIVRTEHKKIWVMRSSNGHAAHASSAAPAVDLPLLQQAIHADCEVTIKRLMRAWIPESALSANPEAPGATQTIFDILPAQAQAQAEAQAEAKRPDVQIQGHFPY